MVRKVARKPPLVRSEGPYDVGTACGTSDQSQAGVAHRLSQFNLLAARNCTLRKPTLVIRAGALHSSPEVLKKEIGSRYSGKFVIGRDLDGY